MYAIETFGSSGTGEIKYDYETSHYMRTKKKASEIVFKHSKSKALLKVIDDEFHTLAFCRKWLD